MKSCDISSVWFNFVLNMCSTDVIVEGNVLVLAAWEQLNIISAMIYPELWLYSHLSCRVDSLILIYCAKKFWLLFGLITCFGVLSITRMFIGL